MARAEEAQLPASTGMARQYGMIELECIDDRQDVLAETVRVVVFHGRLRLGRHSGAAPGDGVDVMLCGEQRREIIKGVGRVAVSGHENQRRSLTTPVEH